MTNLTDPIWLGASVSVVIVRVPDVKMNVIIGVWFPDKAAGVVVLPVNVVLITVVRPFGKAMVVFIVSKVSALMLVLAFPTSAGLFSSGDTESGL